VSMISRTRIFELPDVIASPIGEPLSCQQGYISGYGKTGGADRVIEKHD